MKENLGACNFSPSHNFVPYAKQPPRLPSLFVPTLACLVTFFLIRTSFYSFLFSHPMAPFLWLGHKRPKWKFSWCHKIYTYPFFFLRFSPLLLVVIPQTVPNDPPILFGMKLTIYRRGRNKRGNEHK